MSDVSAFHKEQLEEYARWFRHHREALVDDVQTSFTDVTEHRLFEDKYDKEDVKEILDGLCNIVRGQFQDDLQATAAANTLLLKTIFLQADEILLQLKVDTTQLSNQMLLKSVKGYEDAEKQDKKPQSLQPMASAAGLQNKVGQLEEENKSLRDRFQKLQVTTTTMMKEKTAINDELQALKAAGPAPAKSADKKEAAPAKAVTSPEVEKLTKEAAALKAQLDDVTKDLAEQKKKARNMEQELTKKVSATTPFINMKKMLQTKNGQVKELRTKLNKYEPQADAGDD